MADSNRVLILQTGGTIDKEYPRSIGGYAFEIKAESSPASFAILSRARVDMENVRFQSVCRKDSTEIDGEDLHALLDACQHADERKILVTHGSDTILNTANCLTECASMKKLTKRIVLTGSMLPESFKNSDADFNLGMAWATLHCAEEKGVFVCIDGLAATVNRWKRDTSTGKFFVVPALRS